METFEEKVLMNLPPGFERNLGPNKIYRLKNSLYSLKQSPKAWFERFGRVMTIVSAKLIIVCFTNIIVKARLQF